MESHPDFSAAGPAPASQAGARCGDRDRLERLCDAARSIASAALRIDLADAVPGRRETAVMGGARHVAMYLAHVSFQLSLTEVASGFNRDRTSVAYALQRVEDRRDEPGYDRELERMERLAACFRDIVGPSETGA